MNLTSSHERINAIGEKLGSIGRYLEIGVAKGTTFFNVTANEKHGVDPRFRFNPESRKKINNEFYHAQTSDDFFIDNFKKDKTDLFDLIFLDGLHTFSQTLKDFLSSRYISHSRTVWLIDDTVPADAISAEPNLLRVQSARLAMDNVMDQTWMGDVFKVIVFINDFLPEYSCYTLKDHGQTIILPSPQKEKKIFFGDIEKISRLNYIDFLLLKSDLFAPITVEHALYLIGEAIPRKAS